MHQVMIAALLVTAAPQESLSKKDAAWDYTSKTDPISDKKVSSAWIWSPDHTSRLSIRCDSAVEQVVSIQYSASKFLGSSSRPVTLRFDQLPPVTLVWRVQDRVVYESNEKQVANLAKLIATSSRLFIRAYDYNDQPVDAQFALSGGFSAKIAQAIFRDCGYPDPLAPGKQ